MQQGASDKGYTLVEILIVVTILGIVALVAIPNFSSNTHKLDLAVAETVQAIRFARSEAIRTGQLCGVRVNPASDRVQLFRITSLLPPTFAYDVRHPVDKKLYDLQFQSDQQVRGIDISNVTFQYAAAPSVEYLFFSDSGVPLTPNPLGGAAWMLTLGNITLRYGNKTSMIDIAPMTGRVSVR